MTSEFNSNQNILKVRDSNSMEITINKLEEVYVHLNRILIFCRHEQGDDAQIPLLIFKSHIESVGPAPDGIVILMQSGRTYKLIARRDIRRAFASAMDAVEMQDQVQTELRDPEKVDGWSLMSEVEQEMFRNFQALVRTIQSTQSRQCMLFKELGGQYVASRYVLGMVDKPVEKQA